MPPPPPQDADTLANLVVAGLHLGKPTARYVTQLRGAAPKHPMLLRMAAAEEAFERAAAALTAAA